MKHSDELKGHAKRLYIDGLSFVEIAKDLSVNAKTVSAWKIDDKKHGIDWDKLRAVNRISDIEERTRTLLLKFEIIFDRAMGQLETVDLPVDEQVKLIASLMDSYSKAVSSSQKLMPEVDKLQIVNFVIEALGEKIAKTDMALLETFLAVCDEFVDEL